MASAKKPTEAEETANKRKSMLGPLAAKFGKKEEDVVLTGQLLPQYLGKQLLEKLADSLGVKKVEDLTNEQIATITPAIGLFDRVEILPVQERQGQEKDFSPFSLILREVEHSIVGFRGKEEKRQEVPVDKGGDILLPITGQTIVNKQVLDMTGDLEFLYVVAARPVGQEKVRTGQSPMVKWEIEVLKTDIKRVEKGASWLLPAWYVVLVASGDLRTSIRNKEHCGLLDVYSTDGIEVNAAGYIINRKSGEPLGRLGESGRVLPPTPEKENTAAQPS
jgi:hypothetical protein